MSGRERCVGRAGGPLALAVVFACGRAQVTPGPPALASAPTSAPAAPSASTVPLDPALASATTPALPPDLPWPALVRDEEWDAAWQALEAVPDSDKVRPEVRYVRARVALFRGDAAGA